MGTREAACGHGSGPRLPAGPEKVIPGPLAWGRDEACRAARAAQGAGHGHVTERRWATRGEGRHGKGRCSSPCISHPGRSERPSAQPGAQVCAPPPAPAGLTRPLSPGHRGQPDRGLPAWPGKPRSDLPECSNPSPSGHIPLPSNRLLMLSPSGDRRCREPAPRSGSPVPQAGLHPSLESISETPHWAGGPCFPSHVPHHTLLLPKPG